MWVCRTPCNSQCQTASIRLNWRSSFFFIAFMALALMYSWSFNLLTVSRHFLRAIPLGQFLRHSPWHFPIRTIPRRNSCKYIRPLIFRFFSNYTLLYTRIMHTVVIFGTSIITVLTKSYREQTTNVEGWNRKIKAAIAALLHNIQTSGPSSQDLCWIRSSAAMWCSEQRRSIKIVTCEYWTWFEISNTDQAWTTCEE